MTSELKKELGTYEIFTIGFGAIVAAGWIMFTGDWLAKAGPLGAIIAFGVPMLFFLFVGFAYGEMTSTFPRCGGEVSFIYSAFGRNQAFWVGWVMLLAYIGLTANMATQSSLLLAYAFPALKVLPLYQVAGAIGPETVFLPTALIGSIIAILTILLNYYGVKVFGRVQAIATTLLLVGIFVFAAIGLSVGKVSNATPLFSDKGLNGILTLMAVTPMFYLGFDMVPQAAEEAKIKYNRFGLLIILSILVGGAFWMSSIGLTAVMVPWQSVSGDYMAGYTAVTNTVGVGWADLIILFGFFGIVSTLLPAFMASSRVLYAQGRAKLLPGAFSRLHPKHKTPTVATFATGVLAIISPWFGKTSMIWWIDVASLCTVLMYGWVCLSAIGLRRKNRALDRPYKMPGGSLSAVAGLLFCIFLVGTLAIPWSPGALAWPVEWGMFLGWLIVGAAIYVWGKKARELPTKKEMDTLILGAAQTG